MATPHSSFDDNDLRDEINEDTADIVQVRIGSRRVWKIIVTRPDGEQFLSDSDWSTSQEAEDAFVEHLKELGVPDYEIKRRRLH